MFKRCFLCIKYTLILLLASLLFIFILIVPRPTHSPIYDPPISDNPVPSLAAVAALPPHVNINYSCHPPSLPPSPDCHVDPGFTGEQLVQPRKLVLMILFSFEVDTLEIMLKEVQDLVDFIFIVESSVTHRGVSHVRFAIRQPIY